MTTALHRPSCPGCGHPTGCTTTEAVLLVRTAPERYAALLAGRTPLDAGRAPESGAWPPVAYLWHVVDVLRFGAERLWMLTIDPTSTVVPWDADTVASARGYDRLSVPVGLHALRLARDTWLDAFTATPPSASAEHPEIGRMTAAVMAERNAHEVVHHAADIAAGLERPPRTLSPGGPA